MIFIANRTRFCGRHLSIFAVAIAVLSTGTCVPGRATAETIKIGVLKVTAAGPVFIAQERGYFAAEGLAADLVFISAPQPFLTGLVAGDLDISLAGLSAAFYTLAGQGALRIVGGNISEAPGFISNGLVASNLAYEAGLRAIADLPGHSVALAAVGTPTHYELGLLAEKYHFDPNSMRVMQTGSFPNSVSAVVGGSADATAVAAPFIKTPIQRGDLHLLAWFADEVPMQIAVILATTSTANEKGDLLARFLRVYRRGARDYRDAFTGPNEVRHDAPTAPKIFAILAKYIGQPAEDIKLQVAHVDAEGRLNVKDVLRQIAWYKSVGLVKGDFDPERVMDMRYVVPLPEK